jgi:hypothetical protein
LPLPDYAPEVADVGDLLRARTKDVNGSETGTFTADTRPTDDAVEAMIEQALSTVTASANDDVPERLYPLARHCAALRCAMLVELTYWPEQVQRENSPYAHYRELYTDAMLGFTRALDDSGNRRGRGPLSVVCTTTIENPDPDA